MKNIGEIVAFRLPERTEAEWAEHDARVERKRLEEEATQKTAAENKRRRDFTANGFTVRALDAALVADESKPALVRVRSWAPENESVLVLSGSAGCGKTVAATWWAWHRAPYARFLRSTTFAASSRYNHEQRDEWLNASALVLDDLGTEYVDAKGNFQVDLDELIDTYYGDRKPLIITTNCTPADFKTRYGSRVVDRVRECGSWFSIASESLRRKS